MQFDLLDFSKVALAVTFAITLALGWVHGSTQKQVARSLRNSLTIALRITLVYVIAYVLICVLLGLSIDVLLIVSSIMLLLMPFASLDMTPSADELGFAIGITIMVPVYILKQFMLGFPDHDRVVLSPPAETLIPPDLSGLKAAVGIVASTLKPSGKVSINGTEYSATSMDGRLLDQGTRVQVSEVRNFALVVKELREPSGTPANQS